MVPKLLDARQIACWENYANPESPSFGNQRQSAIRAGYGPAFADKVADQEWFQGRIRRLNMRIKAEKVLDEMLEMPVQRVKREGFGEDSVEVVVTDTGLVKIKQDTAKFAAERLGKDDWSTRQEITGAEGGPVVDAEKKEKSDSILTKILNGYRASSDSSGK
jgi:hypothetical protein